MPAPTSSPPRAVAKRSKRPPHEIEAKGRRTLRLTSDVKDRGSLVSLREAVLEFFGKVDILINCAGTTKRGPTLTFPKNDWNHILETNLTGTLRGCQVFGEAMLGEAATGASSTSPRSPPLSRSTKWQPTPRAKPLLAR
jgi:NAD(P)-dependent dehydrogenase (short-subunit alcohol dehydrogenase family)